MFTRAKDWLLNSYAARTRSNKRRLKLYRAFGIEIGEATKIGRGAYFTRPSATIGKNVFINTGCEFQVGGGGDARVTIGDECRIAMGVTFVCVSHEIGDSHRRAGADTFTSIEVGNGSWIGAKALILPGVHVGNGCIIAAGSVVTKDCESNCMYAGVPAKLIRRLE